MGQAIPGSAHFDEGFPAAPFDAWTYGNQTWFRSSTPPLEVAAHEAAHQLQHAGVTNDAGLGPERHASTIATRISTGQDARGLLTKTGAAVPPRLRPYTAHDQVDSVPTESPEPWKSLRYPIRISDTLETVTSGTHDLFATKPLVDSANKKLEKQDAGVELSLGPDSLELNGSTLHQVNGYPFASGKPNNPCLPEACVDAALELMGPRSGRPGPPLAKYRDLSGWDRKTLPSANPESLRDQILAGVDQLGDYNMFRPGGTELGEYQNMNGSEAQKFDESVGINEFANPEVGESFVMEASASVKPRDPNTRPEPGDEHRGPYRFHWAMAILKPGHDTVTMENSADPNIHHLDDQNRNRNTLWTFQTYGPASKTGQTFYEQHSRWAKDRTAGAMTMVAALPSFENEETARLLIKANDIQQGEPPEMANYRSWVRDELRKRSFTVRIASDGDYLWHLIITWPGGQQFKTSSSDEVSHPSFKISLEGLIDSSMTQKGKSIDIQVKRDSLWGKEPVALTWDYGDEKRPFAQDSATADDVTLTVSLDGRRP